MINRFHKEVWIIFGGLCLAVSGVLSLPIFLGKIPMLSQILPNLTWTKWSLVIHVILALIMWHITVPIGINFIYTKSFNLKLSYLSLFSCLLGSCLLFFSFPSESVTPLLINYIPFLSSWVFIAGVMLCLLGALGGFLSSRVISIENWRDEVRFPLQLGALFYVMTFITLLFAIYSQKDFLLKSQFSVLEYVVWGPGHLLQHISSLYLIVSWNILLAPTKKDFLMQKELFPSYLYLALSFLIVPFLLFIPTHSLEYRQGFTMLMQWGIFPAFIFFYLQLFRHRKKLILSQVSSYKLIAFIFSSALLILGFIFGALIDGYNLKVPGHYHATIGSVTLTFMILVLHFLSGGRALHSRKLKFLVLFYGVGQILFSAGLFVAGIFQMERKTYGSEIELLSIGKKTGITIAAAGGSLALIGGVLFVVIFFSLLLRLRARPSNLL